MNLIYNKKYIALEEHSGQVSSFNCFSLQFEFKFPAITYWVMSAGLRRHSTTNAQRY